MSDLNSNPFGGDWSGEKLDALSRYLRSYTTALKNQPFDLIYIDAFAGAGAREIVEVKDESLFQMDLDEVRHYRHGSPLIALETKPQFNRFVFIDKDRESIARLKMQVEQSGLGRGRPIKFDCGDANEILQEFTNRNWSGRRAVAFLDPFALHVTWNTIASIATTKSIDMWLLFPAMAVNRMLPRSGVIPDQWVEKLNETFGASDWFDFFYRKEADLFGDEVMSKTPKVFQDLSEYVTGRLSTIFSAVNKKPMILRNSVGSPLFLLCFASGSPRGGRIAVDIAQHIIDKNSHGH